MTRSNRYDGVDVLNGVREVIVVPRAVAQDIANGIRARAGTDFGSSHAERLFASGDIVDGGIKVLFEGEPV